MSSNSGSSIKPPRPPPPSYRPSSQTNINHHHNDDGNQDDSQQSTNKSPLIASDHAYKSSNDHSQHHAINNDNQYNKSHTNLLFQQDLDPQQQNVATAITDSNKQRAPKWPGQHGDQPSFKRDTVSIEATPLASLSESDEDELIFQLPSSTRGKAQLKNSQEEDIKMNTTLTGKVQSADHDSITAKTGPISQSKMTTNTHDHLTNRHVTSSGPKDERESFFRHLKREQNNNYLPALHFTKSTDDVLLHGSSGNLHKDEPRKQASLPLNDDGKNDQIDAKPSTQLNFVESYFEKVQHQQPTTSSVPSSYRPPLTKTLSASEGSNLNKVTHEQNDQLSPQKSPDRLKKRSNQLSSGNRSQPGISPPPLRRSSGPVGVSLSSLLESQKEVSDTTPIVDYSRKEMTSSSLSLDRFNDHDQNEVTTIHRDTNLTATGSLLKSTPIDKTRLPHNDDQMNISATTIFSLSFSIYSIYALPISPFWYGLLSGLFIMYFLSSFFVWLSLPSFTPEDTSRPPPRPPPFHYSYISRLQQLSTVKGWMYGKRKYDQDQHYKTDLRCVYARLDGNILRLSKPQSDDLTIPFKPEKWNVSFVNQKLLDLTNAKIQLLPKTLSKNKLWSKKYPIAITLAEGKSFAGAPTTSIDKNPLEYQVNADKIQLPNVDPSSSTDRERDRSFYLFATTSHDKEYWFYRLQNSAESKKDDITTDKEPKSYPGYVNPQTNRSKTFAEMQAIYYSRYMAKLILQPDNKPKAKQSPQQPQPPQAASSKNQMESSVIAWLNALLGRAFFDFWREKYWSDKMLDMIQRRISKLNRPNYIKELIVTDLDLGGALPSIRGASAPTLDERGLWIDLDIFYHGSFAITLETSLNITRPKPDTEMDATDPKKEVDPSKNDLIFTLQGLDKSDSESSDADDDPTLDKQSNSSNNGSGSQQNGNSRWSRFIKKVGKSKIVQKATNSRLAQRAAEKMSNIPIVLSVEIQSLTGILSVNIPPPPSDRLWYGFRGNPTILMSVKPKLGERKVRLTNITDWIEKKLRHEIKETIVLPHMIDYKITLMGNTMTEVATSS